MPSQHAPSYYAASANPQPERPQLRGAVHADVCIIGAGYTGLSSALHLVEAGYSVAVVEAAKVGWGASGRNGGQIVHSYSRDIDVIEKNYGNAVADAMGGMAFEGARIIRERVVTYGIQCDLKEGGIYAAKTRKKVEALHEHKALWEKYDSLNMQFVEGADIQKHVCTDEYEAILIDPTGGHIHPLNLALGEAAAFESLGGRIFEQSPVTAIQRGTNAVVRTGQGEVHAKFVILACNAYIGTLEPKLSAKAMPCGTQVVATAPLANWQDVLPTDHCVEDTNYLLDYYRLSADKRLIFGGGVVYGAKDPNDIESHIRPNLERTFPQLKGVKIDYAWTGNFLLTLSRLPQVGRLESNIYYAQGCSGHGVTYTHMIGRVLSEAIHGQCSRFDVFAKLPHYPFPGGRLFRVPFTALGALWYDMRDRFGV
ncbi:NAD(P)/FAD-dependent oxidoreductase [Arenimonas sp.]|jgi:gamma-glutamylputrescine oxidase|uniref:NAD(P)/FAD-dependent oxidoreductase n=1 Tax=Arenimonas sp. TaxID=1872635 RepID=UPI0037C15973